MPRAQVEGVGARGSERAEVPEIPGRAGIAVFVVAGRGRRRGEEVAEVHVEVVEEVLIEAGLVLDVAEEQHLVVVTGPDRGRHVVVLAHAAVVRRWVLARDVAHGGDPWRAGVGHRGRLVRTRPRERERHRGEQREQSGASHGG